MPSSSTNTTNVSSSGSSTHLSSHPAANRTNTSTTNAYDPASNLGYGVGRLLRGAFDLASSAWQSWWNPGSLQAEIAHQKQHKIYHQGLEECIKHLDRALDNLRKNPNDPQSVKRIEKLASHYAPYVQPAPTEELKQYQEKLFQPIETQLERLKNTPLSQAVRELLPVLSRRDFLSEKEALSSQERGIHDNAPVQLSAVESIPAKRAVMQQSFPATFDLNSLNGNNGFTVSDIASGGKLGVSVSTAGDINGDNLTDLVLGASAANSYNGTAYVIFGSRGGFTSPFNLANLNGNNGFTVPGIASDGYLGVSVRTAGDINGDNLTDLVLGAYAANLNNGTAYVIFGSRGGFTSPFNLANLNGNNGFTVPGIASDGYLGVSVRTAGDINGDNLTDLVLGAYAANSNNGAAYVIFGSRGGFASPFNLTNLNGNNGFTVAGIASGGDLGASVSTAGDINGDNITDLVLGAYGTNSYSGAAYVIFGSREGFSSIFNLNNLNGSNGFTVPAIASGGFLGNSVSTAGDINGDNITDLVLGAPYANSNNGAAYVIFGSREGFASSFNLNNLNGSNGFMVPGIASGGYLGYSVNTAGDINGDNISDLVLGAYGTNSDNGAAYVIFGSRGGFVSPFNLSNLNGNNGFMIPGIASAGYLGASVSMAGDINGDNITDLILGAYGANSENGTAYVIFGQNTVVAPTPTPTSIPTPTPTPTPISALTPTPTPTFIPTQTPTSTPISTPTPTFTSTLTPCPSTQPLTLSHNDIQINKGQNLRLTPNDLSATCGNSATPNLGTAFTVTGMNHAQFKTRNSSGFWNNASNFFGRDLSQGNVELIQDNSTIAPEINFTVTDGQTTLSAAADVQFSTTESTVNVTNIMLSIQSNGTTILNAQQFPITDAPTKLDNVVISITSVQDGYFTMVNSSTPITDFTYYQLQNGQIQFVQNGTALPKITFSVGDGSGEPVLISPLVNFLNTNNPNTPSVPIAAVVGSVVGTVAVAAAAGMAIFGIFKCRQDQAKKELRDKVELAVPANPVQVPQVN